MASSCMRCLLAYAAPWYHSPPCVGAGGKASSSSIHYFLRRFFVDLRLIACLMGIWLFLVMLIMTEIGIFNNPSFVAFGPRSTLTFMHVSVDTSYKYSMLVLMIVLHTVVSDFIADSLSPHVINTLQDLRCRYIPHRPIVYYVITSLWAVYCAVSQLFYIFLALGQLDLLLVRLASDIAANAITTSLYLENKEFDPQRFDDEQQQQQQQHPNAPAPPKNTDISDLDDEDDDDEVVFDRSRQRRRGGYSATPPPTDDAHDAKASRVAAPPTRQNRHATEQEEADLLLLTPPIATPPSAAV